MEFFGQSWDVQSQGLSPWTFANSFFDYFINSSLLAMSGLAIIPVLLHFLMRNKPKKLIFPALQLLQQRRKQNSRKMRLRHIWLLLLRIGIILFLVFALARPTLPAADYALNWQEIITVFALLAVCAAVYFGMLHYWKRDQLPPQTVAYRRTLLRGGTGTALILLLLLAVVWPYANRVSAEINNPLPTLQKDLPVTSIFLFDTSLSMSYEQNSRGQNERNTRLKIAQDIAEKQAASFRTGSRVAITATSDQSQNIFLTDREAIRSRIADLKIRPMNLRTLDDLLRTAVDQQRMDREKTLREFSSDRYFREIYLLTDLAKNGWDKKPSLKLQQQLAELNWLQIYVIDVGVAQPMNVAISSLKLSQEVIRPKQPLTIDVKLSAIGEGTFQGRLQLNFTDPNGRKTTRDQKAISIEAGTEQTVQLSVQGLTAAVTQGEVVFQPAPDSSKAFTADDVRYFTVAVQPKPKVLIVSKSYHEAKIWLRHLSPKDMLKRDQWFLSEYRPATKFLEEDLTAYDVVYFINVRSPTEKMWEKLDAFVTAGGGLGVMLGVLEYDGKTQTAYDTEPAKKLLPADIIARLDFIPPEVLYLIDMTHPMLSNFVKWKSSGDLTLMRIRKYWKVKPYEGAKTVIAYTDGNNSPALIERRHGNGLVALFTTAVGGTGNWNDLRSAKWYITLSHQLTQFLTGHANHVHNFEQGESIRIPLGRVDRKQTGSNEPTLLRKPRTQIRLTNTSTGRRSKNHADQQRILQLNEEQTDELGHYQVIGGGEKSAVLSAFSLNVDARQTDLTRMTKNELDRILGEERYQLANDIESLDRAVTSGRYGKEIIDLVVLMMILVFCGELFVSNHFYNTDRGTTATEKIATAS